MSETNELLAADYHRLLCPQCGDGEQLTGTPRIKMKLTATGYVQDKRSMSWDSSTPMKCDRCGFKAHMASFNLAYEAENPPEQAPEAEAADGAD